MEKISETTSFNTKYNCEVIYTRYSCTMQEAYKLGKDPDGYLNNIGIYFRSHPGAFGTCVVVHSSIKGYVNIENIQCSYKYGIFVKDLGRGQAIYNMDGKEVTVDKRYICTDHSNKNEWKPKIVIWGAVGPKAYEWGWTADDLDNLRKTRNFNI